MLSIAKLLPREDKFNRYLEQLCAEAHTAATHLKTFIESKDEAATAEAGRAISNCRAQAKSISAEVTKQLCLSFITPFDREDIQLFANTFYRITKTIEKVREHMEIYKVAAFDGLEHQVELIIQEADGMDNIVHALIKGGSPTQIIEKAALLDALEVRGDQLLSQLLVTLVDGTEKARDLIVKKDIYDLMERVIDGYRDAAAVALQISLKHS